MSTLTEIIKNYKSDENILIFNDGGMGKTTQMKQLHDELLKEKSGTIVPLFIDCKSLDFSKTKPVLSAILKHYCGNDCIDTMHMELLENILCREDAVYGKYKYYILIDGLNESESNKYKVIDDIASLVKGGKSRVIVSSRVDENYAVFDNFTRFKLKEFNDKQIVAYLNYKKFNDNGEEVKLSLLNPDLLKILRTPMFLNLFCKTYSADRVFPDMYTKNIVKKSDLLQAFIDKVVEDKAEQHSGENNDPEYIKRKFAIERFLPALAYEMSLLEKYEISEEELEGIFKKFDASYFERFETSIDQYYKRACNSSKERFLSELAYEMSLSKKHETSEEELKAGLEKIDAGYFEKLKTLIDRYYERDTDLSEILNICIYELSCLKANDNYSFNHQVWQDYFCGKFFAACLNYNVTDVFETSTSESVKEFIGDIIEEYKFEDKENLNTPASPIEAFMQKHNLNSKNPITPNQTRNLIEIMKKSRNNNITADYSCLDLRKCNFTYSNFPHSKFENSEVYSGNFINMGHSGVVTCVALSPDGTKIAIGRKDGTLCIFDAETGLQIGEPLTGDAWNIVCAVFISDKEIIGGSFDGSICIWNSITKNVEKLYNSEDGYIKCLTMSSDGKIIFVEEDPLNMFESTIKIWNMEDRVETFSLKLQFKIKQIILSADKKTLCVGCIDKIYIYNIDNCQLEAVDEYDVDSLVCLTMTPDGNYVLSCGEYDGKISVYDVKKRCVCNEIPYVQLLFTFSECTALSTYYDEDSHSYRIVSAFKDGGIAILNVNDGSVVKRKNINVSKEGHDYIKSILLSNKKDKVVCRNQSGKIDVLNMSTLFPIIDPLGNNLFAEKIMFNCSKQEIICTCNDKSFKIYNVKKGRLSSIPLKFGMVGTEIDAHFDGENIILTYCDIILKIMHNGNELLFVDYIGELPCYSYMFIDFSEAKKEFLTLAVCLTCVGNFKLIAQVWNAKSFECKKWLSEPFTLDCNDIISVSRNLKNIAIFHNSSVIKIFNIEAERITKTFDISNFVSKYRKMTFMLYGEKIVLGNDFGIILVLDAETGDLISSRNICIFYTCAKAIDDNKFVVGGKLGEVYIIDTLRDTIIPVGNRLMDFDTMEEAISDLDITPDKKMIIGSRKDGTIKIWSTETGKCLYTFEKIMNANILDCDFTKVHYNGNDKEFFNRIIYQNGGIVPEEYIPKTLDVEE